VGYAPNGEFVVDGSGSSPARCSRRFALDVSLGALANDASVREEAGEWIAQGDPTEAAFLIAERKAGFIEGLDNRFRRVGEVPFTSERKLMSTLQVDVEHDGRVVLATKGAPDVLLARCTHEQVADEARPLGRIAARDPGWVDALAGQAFRTLGTAYRPMSDGLPTSPRRSART
jgi:magnesium-transporting ATPase (P-type)